MHESILEHAQRRYLKMALLGCALAVGLYLWHDPRSVPNGGTWLGYTLGGVSAGLIFWLAILGIRKRSYTSSMGSLKGWTSAHAYLGLALLVLATLHTGFQFGWNVHTFCYVLMVLVIGSGVVGVVVYLRYPEQMSANRVGSKPKLMLEEIDDLDRRALRLAADMPRRFNDVLRSNRQGMLLGGNGLAILRGQDRSTLTLSSADGSTRRVANADQSAVLAWLGSELAASAEGTITSRINDLLSIVVTRRNVLRRLRRDAQLRGVLVAWLYFHVPLTLGLIGALIAHVASVFLYW